MLLLLLLSSAFDFFFVVVVVVVVVVVLLLFFFFLFISFYRYPWNTSLRPPLHVSTFDSLTLVSMFSRLCHLFVHALSTLQVVNPECMTLMSLAPGLRAACEKHRFAAGKERKKPFGSTKKKVLQRTKTVCAAGKNVSKKCRFAAGKMQSSKKKHLAAAKKQVCSRRNAFWRQREKPSEAGKTRPRQDKKPAEAGKKLAAEKPSFATQNAIPGRELCRKTQATFV